MSDTTQDLDQVAIIGMAGRFPGAPDVETFWDNLAQGREGIEALSDQDLLGSGEDPALLGVPGFVKAKGVLPGGDLFDAGFFGISPREAEIMDPQHRVFLECVWESLESAGCDPHTFRGRIGVFAGSALSSYLLFNLSANQRAVDSTGRYQTLIANDKDFLTTRVSYKLNLRGPSVTVQTACSTSLTAVHLACQSLLNGECDIAVAGGVAVSVPLKGGYLYEPGGILSPDGHCRAFDAGAGGTVPGNGVGAVVLRTLSEARLSGDTVAAVIRGTAINNDGSLKVGYTAPSVDGQAEVIAEALAVAGVDPATIGYVETHGTGTALGDPIELAALTRAYREHTQDTGFCAIGSVKTNVGHLDAAAGVTALIKATLALQHEAIPATLHFSEPNPELALESSPFFVNTQLRPWPRQDAPRRAGVSSFGIGGTNVHVILQEAPLPQPREPARSVHLLGLSARSEPALATAATRLADHLESHPDQDLGDVAFTLARGRRDFTWRQSVVCQEPGEAVSALRRLGQGHATRAAAHPAPVAFLFPGQGAQYVDMARDLYEHEPCFAQELDRCAALFESHLGQDLRALLFPSPDRAEAAATTLDQTAITQPVIFMVEYALARLWSSWGVQPQVMAGHSIGEYVAACLAGVFSLADAVRLVAARGRLIQSMDRGAMLALFLPEAEAIAWLGDDLCLAAVNSTSLSVVSGPTEAVDDLEERLRAAGIGCRKLHTSHAFHSPSLDGAVAPFVDLVRRVRLSAPRIPFCSNVTGTWITDEQATSPQYWGTHLRQTVRFADCLDLLLGDPALVMLEVGPGQMLANFVRQHQRYDESRTVLGSLRHPKEKRDDRAYLLASLAGLWGAGVPVDWTAYYEGQDRRSVRLPTYPFERQRYWIDPDSTATDRGRHDAPEAAESVADWFYTPGWRRLPPFGPPAGEPIGNPVDSEALVPRWVVLGADRGLGRDLARELEADGGIVVRVSAADELRQDSDRSWSLDPASREHYDSLLESLATPDAAGPQPLHLVHLWSLDGDPADQLDADQLDVDRLDAARLDRARRLGLDSLLAIAQAIGGLSAPRPVEIDVLCQGLRSVTGEEPLQPENATLLGACTVIPQELADVTCRTLDLTGVDPRDPSGDTVQTVRSLLLRPTDERDLALRGRHWWVRDFDAVRLGGQNARTRLRDDGVFLVTGGLGGVGLAIAEHLAASVERPVLGLLSRSGFPAEQAWDQWLGSHADTDATSIRIGRLRHLAALGARVLVLQGDVTDAAETSRAVGLLRSRFGAINGVVHAAGVPAQGLIMGKTGAEVDEVLAAKTRGTLVLDAACQGDELDFVLLCSSLTSVLGGPGQSDYCAANAFLDVFAQSRRDRGAPVFAVAWDTWRGVGMAAGLASMLGAGEPASGPTGHPLLRRLVRKTGDSLTYLTTFSTADSWIVDEHRIMGHGLVPGTTYLELVRAAVSEQARGRVIELRDVLFLMPVIVPDGQTRDVYTTVDLRDGQLSFTVQSRVGAADGQTWQQHATGDILFHERETEVVRDLAEVVRRCAVTEVIDTEEELKRRLKLDLVEAGEQLEFSFGQRWRCLRRIQSGDHRMLVTLELNEAFASDLDDYPLHPALLDVAGAAARIKAQFVYYLPFTYRSVRISSGLTSTIHCYVELKESGDSSGETLTCDIEVLDPQGRSLVTIVDFTIKRINDIQGLVDQIAEASEPPPEASGDTAAGETAHSALRALSEGMSSQQAVAALALILAAPSLPGQLVVSRKNLGSLRRLAASITPALLAREIEQIAPLGGTHPRPDLDTAYAAPTTDVEQAVAAVWQEVLGIELVGIDDDFFALGGHSLAAVQIGAKIRSRFGVDLELRSFFDNPTVAATATLLGATGDQGESTQDQIQAQDRDAPDDAQDQIDGLSDDEVDAMLREMIAADKEQPGART